MKFPRTLLTLLLCLAAIPAQAQVFVTGHSSQPLAPLFSGRDTDPDNAYYGATAPSARVVAERIPWHIRAANGDDLVFCEIRDGANDYETSGIGYRRSSNGGATWGPVKTVYVRSSDFANNEPNTGGGTFKWVSGGSSVVNQNGRLFVFFTKGDSTTGQANHVTTVFVTYSDDHGETWSAPTNITSSVKKVDNSTPANLPACYDDQDAAWGWFRFGPHSGTCDADGRLVIPAFHRYTTDQSGTSWAHCIISDDDGDSWYLGGGLQESVSGNDGANELSLVLLPSGDYYANHRVVSGGNGNKRGQIIIPAADITGTWPNYSVMSDGANDIDSNSTAGSCVCDSAGSLWVVCPNDDTLRSRVTVFRSTNGGTSFPVKRVLDYGYSGYSAIWESSPGNFAVAVETTDDYANAGTTDGLASAQMIRIKRFDTTWFENESTYPAVADYHLNDGVAGEATYTGGTEIQAFQGYHPAGKGGANAKWHADGIEFIGSGAGIQLQEAQAGKLGGMFDPGLSDMTYEGEFKLSSTAGTDETLFDSCNGSTTAKGVNAVLATATKKITFRVNEGTHSCSFTTTNTFNDDAWHVFSMVYQRGTGLSVYIDGVKDGSTTADNLTSTTAIAASQPFRVGSRGGGANPLLANCFCRRFRVTRKALSSGFLTSNEAKTSVAKQHGYNPAPAASIPDTTNLKLALFVPQFGQHYGYGSADRFGGQLYPVHPPLDGSGIASYRDHALGRMFATHPTTLKRDSFWDTDTVFGRHVRLGNRGTQSLVSWFGRSAASTDYDFIQNTGRFTWILAVNFLSNQFSTNQVILDNCSASASNPGFRLDRNTNSTMQVGVSAGGGTWRLNEAVSAYVMTDNTWYLVAVVGNQASAKLDLYQGIYTAGVLGSITHSQTSGSLDANGSVASPANTPATGKLTVGAKNTDLSACNVRLGPVLLFDESLNASQIAAWGAALNKSPVIGGVSQNNGINLGIGIGLGASERRIKVPDEFTLAP